MQNATFDNLIITALSGRGLSLGQGNNTFKNVLVNSTSTGCTGGSGCDIYSDTGAPTVTNTFINLTLFDPQLLVLGAGNNYSFTNLSLENGNTRIFYPNLSFVGSLEDRNSTRLNSSHSS